MDINTLRRRLTVMGFTLVTLADGHYMIRHTALDFIVAGSEVEPLSLAQVAAFCG